MKKAKVFLLFFLIFTYGKFIFCEEKDVFVLLSNNGGKGQDFGLKYSYPFDKPSSPKDTYRDTPDTFGNRLLNGQPWGNWWDCIGINYKDLTVDFVWPEKHAIGLIKILMIRPQKPKLIEIQARLTEKDPWLEVGSMDITEPKSWYEYKLKEPIMAKEVRLIFRLKEWGFYIDEVEFWGVPGFVATKKEFPLIMEKDNLILVKEGKPAAKIVVPENPGEKEKKAAQLIQSYIYQMTGAGLPVVEEGQETKGAIISIGKTRLNQQLRIKQANYPEKEISIVKRKGSIIHIAGNDAGSFSGTVRAAYLFLEHLGCGFYGPAEHWKVVPKTQEIKVGNLDVSLSPAFSHRNISWPWSSEKFDREAWGLGGVIGNHSHAYYRYIPAEKYFKEHPEYFALVGGNRKAEGAQICFSNPDVQKIIIERAREYFNQDPSRVMFSLSANDTGGFCECEECNKLGKTPGEKSLAFANIIAKELRKTHPDKYVIFYAYWFTAKAPENMKAEPGVFAMVINNSCKAHSLSDSGCPGKKNWVENFLKWKDTGARLSVYEWYIPGCNAKEWGDTPFIPGESALIDLRLWKKNQVEWIFYQSGDGEKEENYPIRWPMYYTIAKGMENPDVSYEQLIKQACDKLFGPASETMAEFYIELSKILNKCTSHSGNWTPPKIQDVYSIKDMQKLRGLLGQALKLASTAQEQVVWRVNDVIKCWVKFEDIYKNLPLKKDA